MNPRFEFYRHCEILINVLERVVSGELKRVIIEMPPRHGKSELVSRILPAYFLHRHPAKFVALASYSFELAGTLSRMARENYVNAGGRIRPDAGAVKHFETLAGGGCWAVGTGGSATGRGFSLGLLDDPLKDFEESSSLLMRDKLEEWYHSVFYTRAEPDAAIVIVQTRWHEDDLLGRLLKSEYQSSNRENFHIVSLPALYEPLHSERFPLNCTIEPDFRTEEGEALCPERYSKKRLEHVRSQIGGFHWDALYMQRPTSPEGALFDVTKIETVKFAPIEVVKRMRGWDFAATKNGGDHTAGVRISKGKDDLFYIESVVRGQWDTASRDRMIRHVAEHIDGKATKVIGEQEPGSAGVGAAAGFIRLLGGYSVKTEKVSGSKEIRADAFSAQVNAGNVRMVQGDWNAEFIEELRQFPRGRHDDQVDAASLAFNEIAEYKPWVIGTRQIYG